MNDYWVDPIKKELARLASAQERIADALEKIAKGTEQTPSEYTGPRMRASTIKRDEE